MKRSTSNSCARRLRVLLPVLLLGLALSLLWKEPYGRSGEVEWREGAPALPAPTTMDSAGPLPASEAVRSSPAALIPPTVGAAWAMLESDGFTTESRKLAMALDTGCPLLVRSADGAAQEFLIRPRRLLGDNFQITLGQRRDSTLPAGIRSYEGREGTGGAVMHAAIAGGAFAAEIEEANGTTRYLRTDEASGELKELRRTLEQKRCTCEHDPVTGIASTKSTAPPITELEWQGAASVAIEPREPADSGFDPATGRLDKYVQPIAAGHHYEVSLRDNLAIITLDKLATGVNTVARLTQITSEYLAKAGNLATIQESNLGVRYLVQELILTPDDAAYTEVPGDLGGYGSWISGQRPRGTYDWDLSTRFGESNFTGGTIGRAWVRALGTTSPVNVCQKGYSVSLEAHEQGHNLGSDHSSGGIMNPSINGSRDFFTDVLAGETSAMQIWKHAATRLTGSVALRHAEETPWAVDDTVDTPAGQAVEILPLTNDLRFVRNGLSNADIKVEEVSRVYPIHAGTAVVLAGDRIRFTPAPGYEGQAWFSYSLRGSVGNGGQGWLHKADVAVQVGTWDRNSLNLRLAPGQEFSFRPSSTTDVTIVSQPAWARVDTARDDRRLIIIRVLAEATGTDSFVIQRAGVNDTVNLTYVTNFLQTRPDSFMMEAGQTSIRFSPMANDQGAGYRNLANVLPIIGAPTSTAQGVSFFPGAFRFTGATFDTPAKGTLSLSTRRFTLNSVSTLVNSGQVTFTPAANAQGVARITYTVQDAAGITQSNTATIILPLGEISSPSTERAMIAPDHGIMLEAATWPTVEAPLTGVITALWSVVDAPPGAVVTMDNPAATRTGASFSRLGTYQFRLTLTDNGFTTSDEVEVIVESSNGGPVDTLVAWWKLDEASGSVALDASGAARNGTLMNGITRAPGIIGSGSITADGTDDFVELTPHTAVVQSLAQGTISAWFKTNTASLRPIFSVSDNRDVDRYLRIYLEGGILKYKVLGDTGTDSASLASPGTANDDQWHHAAVTVDASRNAKLYLDGALVREGSRPFCNAVFNLNSMAIGRTVRSNGSDYWRGGVDDVRIYARPLTDSEILSLARLSENRAPVITLGAGPVTSGSRTIDTSMLAPSVSDDGRPGTTITRLWTASGPGTMLINAPTAPTTSITAPSEGTWKLRLEAGDGAVQTWRQTPVIVSGNNPGAPYSSGIPPVRVPLSAPPVLVNLFDVFGDPNGPDESLIFTVITNSNPSLFTSVAIPTGTPRQLVLSFAPAAPGSATLTVRATDATGAFVDAPLQVSAENFAPVIPAASFSISENAPAGTLVGTLTASDPEGSALRFTIVEGNELNAFALDPISGGLTVATPFALDYENRPNFILKIRAREATQASSFAEGTITIQLANTNEAPTFLPQNFTLRAASPAGAVAGTLTAGDPEGNPLTFAITAGNTAGAFSLTSGNILTVANAAALDITTNPRFTLTITAADDAVPPAIRTAIIRVTLEAALIAQGSALRWRVPSSSPADGYSWIQRNYNDTAWLPGTSGIGYDTNPDYLPLLGTNLQATMYNLQSSVFVRMAFAVPDPSKLGRLTLRMKYEDGYWAWINGAVAAHHGAPDPVAWNSVATDTYDEDAAVTFRDEDVSPLIASLVTGSNTLAIQGLNESIASSDLLVLPELVWSSGGTATVPDAPFISASLAVSNSFSTATISGNVTDKGGAPVAVTLWWGRVDGGTNPEGWEQSIQLPGTYAEGVVTRQVSALLADTRYFFRYSATHSGGIGWSGSLLLTMPANPVTQNFASWIASFPSVSPALTGPNADADADGLTNLLEYGLGGDPSNQADAITLSPTVEFSRVGGQPVLDFTWRRRIDRIARGLDYSIQLSENLPSGWTVGTGETISGPLPVGDGVTERLTQRFLLPANAGRRFIRLQVTAAP